jgi:hypothetical protein
MASWHLLFLILDLIDYMTMDNSRFTLKSLVPSLINFAVKMKSQIVLGE